MRVMEVMRLPNSRARVSGGMSPNFGFPSLFTVLKASLGKSSHTELAQVMDSHEIRSWRWVLGEHMRGYRHHDLERTFCREVFDV